MGVGFFIDIPVLIIGFIALYIYRKDITAFLLRFRIPNFFLAVLSSIPFIIYEENINCGAIGCESFHIFPWTGLFLIPSIALLYGIMKIVKAKRYWTSLIVYTIIGTLFEVLLGGANEQFRTLPPVWFIIIFLWTMLSYGFLAVIPISILRKETDVKRKKLRTRIFMWLTLVISAIYLLLLIFGFSLE